MFKTSANLLESIDDLLSGREAPDLTRAPRDADVFSPVSKRTPPPLRSSISDEDFDSAHNNEEESRIKLSPFSLSGINRSKSEDHDFAAASDAFLFQTTIDVDDFGHVDDTKKEVRVVGRKTARQERQERIRQQNIERSKDILGDSRRNDATFQGRGQYQNNEVEFSEDLSYNDVFSLEEDRPKQQKRLPISKEISSSFSKDTAISSRGDMHQREYSITSSTTSSLVDKVKDIDTKKNDAKNQKVMNSGQHVTTLGKDVIEELSMVLRETLKEEMDDKLTDLRNDILNIHSEMVVMASHHSGELKQVVLERDECLSRLKEENERLRADNVRLRRKYGL